MSYLILLKDYLTLPALLQPYTMLMLRVVVGLVFFFHGLPKLNHLKKTAEGFDAMGFKPGHVWGTFVALLEVVGGFALFFGFFSQVFSFFFAILMLVAIIKVKGKMGFVNGYEFDLLLLVKSARKTNMEKLWYLK